MAALFRWKAVALGSMSPKEYEDREMGAIVDESRLDVPELVSPSQVLPQGDHLLLSVTLSVFDIFPRNIRRMLGNWARR